MRRIGLLASIAILALAVGDLSPRAHFASPTMRANGPAWVDADLRVCGERSVAIRVAAPDFGRRVDLEVLTP